MSNKIIQFQYVIATESNPSFLIVLREDGTLWDFYSGKWTMLDSPPATDPIPQE